MEARDLLCTHPTPFFSGQEADTLFLAAMQAAVEHHYDHCPEYRALCRYRGFVPDEFVDLDSLWRLPYLFVNVLKHHTLLSVPADQVVLRLTSSGTTGQTSQVFFDRASLDLGLGMVAKVFDAFGLKDPTLEVNYIAFVQEPRRGNERGTSYTDDNVTKLTARREVVFALRFDERTGDYRFAVDEVLAKMAEFQVSGYPTRFIGFPSFLYLAMLEHERRGGAPFAFGPRCHVITGGGWKVHRDKEVPKAELVERLAGFLGLPAANIRDSFGMVEHGVPYVECEHHRLHVPVYARSLIRDTETLAPLPHGEVGLLELCSPFNLSMPTLAILTSDYAVSGHGCPCGRGTDYFTLLGRAGTRKNKGCAIAALEASGS